MMVAWMHEIVQDIIMFSALKPMLHSSLLVLNTLQCQVKMIFGFTSMISLTIVALYLLCYI